MSVISSPNIPSTDDSKHCCGRMMCAGGHWTASDSRRPTLQHHIRSLHTYFVGDSPVLVHNSGCMSLADALATKHGQERLAERGFDSIDIAIARSSNLAYEQADGAMAHVAQLDDLYNVVIVGERGVVTGMKGLTERELDNLARNYGWSGYP